MSRLDIRLRIAYPIIRSFSIMSEFCNAQKELRELLLKKSVMQGDFTLASGAKSDLYVDCRLTTLDAKGATLVGRVLLSVLRKAQAELGLEPVAVGGLTMGADPLSLSIAMTSYQQGEEKPIQAFNVRKEAKGHGRKKLVEGNFKDGDLVVVVDDVITTGGSTLQAIEKIEAEGGKIAFVVVLVDRQEGGRENIEAKGYKVFSGFTRKELLG